MEESWDQGAALLIQEVKDKYQLDLDKSILIRVLKASDGVHMLKLVPSLLTATITKILELTKIVKTLQDDVRIIQKQIRN